ncbi:HAMP domain-containing sensor histidine kinase [Paraflavitalea sp. CAU 1676]|uniref:sensor histidine kinase n=1 Tax=Paraflavitalea sp. CAU 1676 TaxID=3032598 RepID=UPI0023D9858A|nr:HAMP domain-containing sensor histidine kinase [Paraflavitalea sp. CAU 1676]MDF2188966.1 HAMP domain-containing sensor histidine kinase [Paraflavitalea sp. CAU 1676]
MRIQVKTALLFTLVTAGIILFLSIVVYYFASRFTFNDFHKRLELRARITARIHLDKDESSTAAFQELRQQYLTALPYEQFYILRYDSATKSVSNDPGPKLPWTFYQTIAKSDGRTAYTSVDHVEYAGILYRNKQGGQFLVISSAINVYGEKLIKNLQEALIITFVMGVIVVFTVGLFFSRRVFYPVRNITHQVKDISAHNLHMRLPEVGGGDELTELAQTFNNMLDRLETSFETQNNFVSNASHEFRTPLTTIIGESELALSKFRTEQEYKQTLQVIQHEASKLQHLTKSLLQLAQSGFDGMKQEWGLIRMDELVMNVKHTTDEIEPNNRVKISLHMPDDERQITAQGSDHLLHLALSNIVLNACKYSDNKSVLLSLTYSEKRIMIVVVDEGIGIPAGELKHIFDPFFRATNTNHYEGYGIGLPLTHTILRLHKGDIKVQSSEGKGTTVVVTVPALG